MRKLLRLLFHPLSLPLIWAMYIFTTFFGMVRYFYIVKFGGGERILRLLFSGVWFSSIVFFVIFLITLALWVRRYLEKGISVKSKISFAVVGISSVVMFIVSNVLLKLEDINYANYLYSRFGFTQYNVELVNTISLLVSLFFVVFVFYENQLRTNIVASKYKGIDFHRSPKEIIALLFLAILFWYALLPFLRRKNYLSYLNLSYEMQFEDYQYIEELRSVPEDAKVILPVQSSKWPAISNPPIVRYFLYPRVLISSLYITDQERANSLEEAYFIGLKSSRDGSLWPNVDKERNKIMFKEDVTLIYRELISFTTRDAMIVYKIVF